MRLAWLLVMVPVALSPAAATPRGGPGWHDAKCVRYKRAWAAALDHQGRAGLSPAFLAAHQAFLDSNCTRRADVCARSPAELALANTMVVLSMNFGAASTFAPFYCR
jgi:hypothetical protein